MKITEASAADVPAICKLVNIAYRGDSSRKGWTTEADLLGGIRIDEDMLQQYIADANSTILICTNNHQEIIGCVYIKKENLRLYLGMLTVSPQLQNAGIGKLLLQESEKKAIEKDCTSIVMTVISSRAELINWYKRHGFIETGEKQPFPTNERFGKPKIPIEFIVLEKRL